MGYRYCYRICTCTLGELKMKDRIEVALIIGTSLVAIGALALWGAWLMACMAIA